jgi:hypothetical protein
MRQQREEEVGGRRPGKAWPVKGSRTVEEEEEEEEEEEGQGNEE